MGGSGAQTGFQGVRREELPGGAPLGSRCFWGACAPSDGIFPGPWFLSSSRPLVAVPMAAGRRRSGPALRSLAHCSASLQLPGAPILQMRKLRLGRSWRGVRGPLSSKSGSLSSVPAAPSAPACEPPHSSWDWVASAPAGPAAKQPAHPGSPRLSPHPGAARDLASPALALVAAGPGAAGTSPLPSSPSPAPPPPLLSSPLPSPSPLLSVLPSSASSPLPCPSPLLPPCSPPYLLPSPGLTGPSVWWPR